MYKNIEVETTLIGVVGAGSWGTALANLLADNGFKVELWVYEEDVKNQIENNRENRVFLPEVVLSDKIFPSNDLKSVVSDKDIVLLVVPSHHMRQIAEKITDYISKDSIIVTASKGIENKTHLTMTGILTECLPNIPKKNFTVLSGPGFAKEVAQKMPTVVTVASEDLDIAGYIQYIFANPYFRVYTNNDVIGVELGGAVKNVIAIAAGIADGLELGLNTRAALITRGLVEIRRLGSKLGAKYQTFAGLTGVGDLILTCTGNLSRNHTVGVQLGKGKLIKQILEESRMVAEGVKTAKSVYNFSRKLDVELPICNEVYHVLYDNSPPKEAVKRLMTRDLGSEID